MPTVGAFDEVRASALLITSSRVIDYRSYVLSSSVRLEEAVLLVSSVFVGKGASLGRNLQGYVCTGWSDWWFTRKTFWS